MRRQKGAPGQECEEERGDCGREGGVERGTGPNAKENVLYFRRFCWNRAQPRELPNWLGGRQWNRDYPFSRNARWSGVLWALVGFADLFNPNPSSLYIFSFQPRTRAGMMRCPHSPSIPRERSPRRHGRNCGALETKSRPALHASTSQAAPLLVNQPVQGSRARAKTPTPPFADDGHTNTHNAQGLLPILGI